VTSSSISALGTQLLRVARAANAVVHRRSLRKLDGHEIPHGGGEVRLFAVLRNEAPRVPWFLRYYEQLGVDRFFIVDNDSSDGTRDLLLGRRNVHLFHTKRSYRNAEYGCVWREVLFRAYGVGHWCVAVDADEMFIYPEYETVNLRGLARSLESEGVLGLRAIWVQMYSDLPLRKTELRPGDEPLMLCPYFDGSTLEASRHPAKLAWIPSLNKAPFFFLCEGGPTVWVGQHEFVWPDRRARESQISKARGAVLHFKFTSDLYAKLEEEMRRREHFASKGKYGGFLSALDGHPDLVLTHQGSVRFEGSEQLVELGIMREGPLR